MACFSTGVVSNYANVINLLREESCCSTQFWALSEKLWAWSQINELLPTLPIGNLFKIGFKKKKSLVLSVAAPVFVASENIFSFTILKREIWIYQYDIPYAADINFWYKIKFLKFVHNHKYNFRLRTKLFSTELLEPPHVRQQIRSTFL